MKRLSALLLSLLTIFSLTACENDALSDAVIDAVADAVIEVIEDSSVSTPPAEVTEEPAPTQQTPAQSEQSVQTTPEPSFEPEASFQPPVEEGAYYYDLENVILYLEYYGELPENYITKNEARDLGWEGGTPERFLEGSAIGGDTFGNRENRLPKQSGRSYTECDLNTDGESSRGAERLVFSNDGLYFHTEDHYEHFTQYTVTEDWEVVEW